MVRQFLYSEEWPVLPLFLRYAAAFLACVAIFALRDFESLHNPVFVTEDGPWLHTLERYSWRVMFDIRSDYFVIGNVALLYLAKAILYFLFSNNLFRLPMSLAISSWLFYGFVAFLPAWLLRKHFSLQTRVLLVLLTCFIPIGMHPQLILGRISNVGYLFYVLAFWLSLYLKLEEPRGFNKFFAYAGFILCVLTNPISVALLVLLFLPFSLRSSVHVMKHHFFLLISSGAIFCIIAWRIYNAGNLTGAHPHEYGTARTYVEFWVGRSLAFPFLANAYKHLTDWFCILFTFALLAITAYLPDVKLRKICWLVVLAYFIQVAALFAVRFSLTRLMQNYTATFPGHYFITPNWLAVIWVTLIISGLRNKVITLTVVGLYFINVLSYHHAFLRRDLLFTGIGPWHQSVCWAVQHPQEAIAEATKIANAHNPGANIMLQKAYREGKYIPLKAYPIDQFWYYFIPKTQAEEMRTRCA